MVERSVNALLEVVEIAVTEKKTVKPLCILYDCEERITEEDAERFLCWTCFGTVCKKCYGKGWYYGCPKKECKKQWVSSRSKYINIKTLKIYKNEK